MALDIKPLSHFAHEKIKNSGVDFQFLHQSVFDPLPAGLPIFDSIISDMAPSTSGNRMVDCQNSLELISGAFEIASQHLKEGGHLIVKIFQSQETVDASKTWGKSFKSSKLYRPPAFQKD
ncbi:MAG: ribosomal methyltransferase RrmJ/FtsJ [Bacteriovoracaceae bacterium]|nr:ribosomal methyltransferase RrmJ/FtsJ [Bacteriovoracaceae bacterium]